MTFTFTLAIDWAKVNQQANMKIKGHLKFSFIVIRLFMALNSLQCAVVSLRNYYS